MYFAVSLERDAYNLKKEQKSGVTRGHAAHYIISHEPIRPVFICRA